MSKKTAVVISVVFSMAVVVTALAISAFYGNCVRRNCDLSVGRSETFADVRAALSENIRHMRRNMRNRLSIKQMEHGADGIFEWIHKAHWPVTPQNCQKLS